ncbi:hypothetical protein SAMN05428962_2034 [Paenibacillus sp. BC26]|nr:hypothetical protein SAMN05428962_2034 [Paenibacillus sp. BC26]
MQENDYNQTIRTRQHLQKQFDRNSFNNVKIPPIRGDILLNNKIRWWYLDLLFIVVEASWGSLTRPTIVTSLVLFLVGMTGADSQYDYDTWKYFWHSNGLSVRRAL